MFDKVRLNRKIVSSLDALAEAYNRRNKQLYKQCLISLEMDLNEYRALIKEEHPADKHLIKWYEKLWEIH